MIWVERPYISTERVKQYCYLRTVINEQCDSTQEIKCHLGKARMVFKKMSAIFKSPNIFLETTMRHLRWYVFFLIMLCRRNLDAYRSHHWKTGSIWNVAIEENAQILLIVQRSAQKYEERSYKHHQALKTRETRTCHEKSIPIFPTTILMRRESRSKKWPRQEKNLMAAKCTNLVWENIVRTIWECYKQSDNCPYYCLHPKRISS